jgi:peptidoglycan hydrolase-like protein with peptidoglycan-binding domain
MTDLDDTFHQLSDRLARRADGLSLAPTSIVAARRRAQQRHQRRTLAIGASGVAVASALVAIRLTEDDAPRTVVSAATSTTDATSTTSSSPVSEVVVKGDTGPSVIELQERLTAQGLDPGPVDGQFGEQTEQAVWAFEGLVLGRGYEQQTGIVDQTIWSSIREHLQIEPRRPGDGTHAEIYLDSQVMVVFNDDSPTLITHVSSGSGETWCAFVSLDTDEVGNPLPTQEQRDVCGVARTPGGVFKVFTRFEGNRKTPLGGMYNPVYFNYSIAVYGAENVPRDPASHGGIRIPMAIAEYFPSLVATGDAVYVWDGEREPEQQGAEDMLPTFTFPNPSATTVAG